jgi:hypothetical protein
VGNSVKLYFGYPPKPDGDQVRTDIWYDNEGRPSASRTATFGIEQVPNLNEPKPQNVRSIKVYKYEKSNGKDTVQTASFSRFDHPGIEKEWSQSAPLDTIKSDLIIPHKQRT